MQIIIILFKQELYPFSYGMFHLIKEFIHVPYILTIFMLNNKTLTLNTQNSCKPDTFYM